jgi:hypothetical protein
MLMAALVQATATVATALDPTRLFEAAGLGAPDPWQQELLLEPWERALLLCSRQVGKSTAAAAIAEHRAVYRPGSDVLILSPSQRQSKETFGKVWDFYRATGKPGTVEKKSELRLRLANGSRILALPGKEETVRGFSSVDLLLLDEAALVPDDLYYTIRPMLAVSGGRLLALSTPKGKRGWFYEEWTGEADWRRVKVTAYDCPRLTDEYLEEERKALGDRWFAQEYLCRFNELSGALFRQDDIEAAFEGGFEPMFSPTAEGEEVFDRIITE